MRFTRQVLIGILVLLAVQAAILFAIWKIADDIRIGTAEINQVIVKHK